MKKGVAICVEGQKIADLITGMKIRLRCSGFASLPVAQLSSSPSFQARLSAIAHHFQRTFHEKVIGSFPTFPQSMMEALERRMGGIELKGADAVQRTLSCFTYIAFMIKHYNYYEESQQKPN
jgi:hypothetical protein